MDRAACLGTKIDFTSDNQYEIETAKRVCKFECPVASECLAHALTRRNPPTGVWGGMDEDERAALIGQRVSL